MVAKVRAEFSDFISALKINFVIEVAGGADLMGHHHEVMQRLADRFRRAVGNHHA